MVISEAHHKDSCLQYLLTICIWNPFVPKPHRRRRWGTGKGGTGRGAAGWMGGSLTNAPEDVKGRDRQFNQRSPANGSSNNQPCDLVSHTSNQNGGKIGSSQIGGRGWRQNWRDYQLGLPHRVKECKGTRSHTLKRYVFWHIRTKGVLCLRWVPISNHVHRTPHK